MNPLNISNLKNQKELVQRALTGGIFRNMMKYKMTVDGLEVGNFYSERLSEVEGRNMCREYAKFHKISPSGVSVERVKQNGRVVQIGYYGKVK